MERDREQHPSIRYSQRELINIPLVRRTVERSGITAGDLVYDIGAGSGAITRVLLEHGARVTAVEKDERMYRRCLSLLPDKRLSVLHADFLDLQLPESTPYKVFANIPFFHTADIIHKLLFAANPPEDCFLIVQKEAAEKYAGVPRETLQSLLVQPVFWSTIVCHLSKSDFSPMPSVDTVVLQFQRRTCRLVTADEYGCYRDFIVYVRESGFPSIKKALGCLLSFTQMKYAARRFGFDLRASPLELTFHQYLSLFQACLVPGGKGLASIRGTEAGMREARKDIVKRRRTSRHSAARR